MPLFAPVVLKHNAGGDSVGIAGVIDCVRNRRSIPASETFVTGTPCPLGLHWLVYTQTHSRSEPRSLAYCPLVSLDRLDGTQIRHQGKVMKLEA